MRSARPVRFAAGEGPRLDPLADGQALKRLAGEVDQNMLAPIYETVALVKAKLDARDRIAGFLRRPLDGRELHGGRAGHARSGTGAAVRLSGAGSVCRR